MVEPVGGPSRIQSDRLLALVPAARAADLFQKGLLLSELVEQRLMCQEGDVLGEVVRRVAPLELLPWLARIDALKDAQPAKVLE